MDHDAAEPVALAQHYAALAGPDFPGQDLLAAGLLRGFRDHRAEPACGCIPNIID
ncbi:hypothetical protein ACFQX4_16410 [Roseomonas sp. GCM10028921]